MNLDNTYLLVPMAGQGKRFRRAGYDTYKPFIPIQDRPMIAHVTEAFPAEVGRIIITSKELLTDEEEAYLRDELNCKIIFIPGHSEGPAYSIAQAANELPLDGSFFLSYCDIAWDWSEEDIKAVLKSDGAVYTHRGFHPHLVRDNYSGFCLPQKDDPDKLAKIQEKSSFTDDWMNEPVSIGLFFVGNGHDMLAAINKLIDNNERVSAEFFPSLMFNKLIDAGKEIILRDLPFYIHWGVPAQLEDFSRWETVVTHDLRGKYGQEAIFQSNLMCMAGEGKRMRIIDTVDKARLPVLARPMWEHVDQRFQAGETTLIASPNMAESLDSEAGGRKLFKLENQTKSQYETLLQSKSELVDRKDFFLTSCDAYGIFDHKVLREQIDSLNADVVVFTFTPSITQRKITSNYTHVLVDGPRISDIMIKSGADRSDIGLAGFFWVRDGMVFKNMEDVPADPDNEMCADHVFKHFVASGLKVMHFLVDQYVHLGTPEEYEEYSYWTSRPHLFNL